MEVVHAGEYYYLAKASHVDVACIGHVSDRAFLRLEQPAKHLMQLNSKKGRDKPKLESRMANIG